MSDSLQPHKLQHARLPCHSLYPEVYSNSCPSSRWCHPIIPSFITFFSSCPQSFPTSRYFPMSQFFPTGGQSIGVSALASVLPMNFQGWFRLALTGLISLQSNYSQESYLASQFKMIQLSHSYMTTGKTIALTIYIFYVNHCISAIR